MPTRRGKTPGQTVHLDAVSDPNVWVGPYRILQRTDRKWIVFKPGMPPGEGTVSGPHGDQGVAERAAQRLLDKCGSGEKTEDEWEPTKQ